MDKADNEEVGERKSGGLSRPAGGAVLALFLVLCVALPRVDFLGELVKEKVVSLSKEKMNLSVSLSEIRGNPITGFSASDVTVSRSDDLLISVKNLSANISWLGVVTGNPKLGEVELDGAEASLDALISLIPKTDGAASDEAASVPVKTVKVNDAALSTRWGDIYFKPSRVNIKDSFNYDLDVACVVNSRDFTLSGAVGKIGGSWSADGVSAGLDGGRVAVVGSLYPSTDAKVDFKSVDLSAVADLIPALGRFGIRGVTSGVATAVGESGDISASEGTVRLDDALVEGLPLEGIEIDWKFSPDELSVKLGQGKIFDSAASGDLLLKGAPADRHLTANLAVRDLKFADWSKRFEEETGNKGFFLDGGISSLSVDIAGPVNALVGKIEMAPSDIGYNDVKLEGLHGAAFFNGKAAGDVNFSATADGREVSASGKLSFGDEEETDVVFSVASYPLQKILSCVSAGANIKTTGDVSLKGRCKGPFGKWVADLSASSERLSINDVCDVTALAAKASYDTAGKTLTLSNSSAAINGASVTAKGTLKRNALDFGGTFGDVDAKRFYKAADILRELNIEGTANGNWKLTGTTESPVLKASAKAGACRFRDLAVNGLDVTAEYANGVLSMKPVKLSAGGGTGDMTCDVVLPASNPDGTKTAASWKMNGKFNGVDFAIINGLLCASEDIGGTVTGDVTAGSDADGGLEWSFDFNGKNVHWREYKVQSVNGFIAGNPREIVIEKADGVFLNGVTAGKGRIAMPGSDETFADAKLELEGSIKGMNVYELLRRHAPSVRLVQGLVEADVKVGGTVGEPRFEGTGRVAPFRYRGFLLPMVETAFHGSLKDIVISDAHALLSNGSLKAWGHFFAQDDGWHGKFDIKGSHVDMKQFGAYLPENFRSRFGGIADFNMNGEGKLSDLSGSGVFSTPEMMIMGVRFKDVKAPFYVSQNYMMIEDLNAVTNDGALTGGVGLSLSESAWGGNLTVLSADLSTLLKEVMPDLKGDISGRGDLKVRAGGQFGRESTVQAGGAMYLRDGEVTSFDAVETVKKYTGGKPLCFKTVQATFTYDGGDLNILPGSQMTAPANDPLYRYVMLDGYLTDVTDKKDLSLFAMGKVNIRALNSFIGAFQSLVSVGFGLTSGEFDEGEALQNVVGGVLSGFAKNEFSFVTMNIGGTAESPEFGNIKVQRAVRQSSAKDAIPTNNSDPDKRSLTQDGNTTFRFKFEVPIGPGANAGENDAKGQVFGQTLENLIKNVDLGL